MSAMTRFFFHIPQIFLTGTLFLGMICAPELRADDWPQWRGTNRDGVWRESGILKTFPRDGVKVRWRARVGGGYSGPVVSKGRVFVTDRRFPRDVERVLCFELLGADPIAARTRRASSKLSTPRSSFLKLVFFTQRVWSIYSAELQLLIPMEVTNGLQVPISASR